MLWTPAVRPLSFSGLVTGPVGGADRPLEGVLVDVYRVAAGPDGALQFQLLNGASFRTGQAGHPTLAAGEFRFANLPVEVEVRTVTSSVPPYQTVEVVRHSSLPTLAFRVSVEAHLLDQGGASVGNQFAEVYDERSSPGLATLAAYPADHRSVALNSATIAVGIPAGDPEAIKLVGLTLAPSSVFNREFHFLRVGRVTRDEIAEINDPHPADAGRTGYMNSSAPSFFPGVIDAPFGGTLHVGGTFGTLYGGMIASDDLYYTVSFSQYTGSLSAAFNASLLTGTTPIDTPLFNKKYVYPSIVPPNGQWQTINMGPFDAQITAVESAHLPTLIGTSLRVYRQPLAVTVPGVEYWPFPDLVANWSSAAAPNGLVVLTLEAYQRTGVAANGTIKLTKLNMDFSINGHLALIIDNRPPVPVFEIYDAAINPNAKFHTALANFGAGTIGGQNPMGICNEMTVVPGQVNQNECILVRYSIQDGTGAAHQHVLDYSLGAAFTPQAVAGAPDSAGIPLRPAFAGFSPISASYTPATPPVMSISNRRSLVVPNADNGWPPEAGDIWTASPCPQYAMQIGLSCSARTIDGWGRLFGAPGTARFIIIKS